MQDYKKKERRLSISAAKDKARFEVQRRNMEQKCNNHDPLKVTIVIDKSLLLPQGLFKTFTVKTNIPLKKKEIDERMAAAFPELEWRDH